MYKKKIILKKAVVLLIAVFMVLTTVIIVAGNNVKKSNVSDSNNYIRVKSIEDTWIFRQLFERYTMTCIPELGYYRTGDTLRGCISADGGISWYISGSNVFSDLPTVEITNPEDGADVSGIVGIEATASDDSGVNKVSFSIDDTEIGWDNSAPYETSWDTSGYSNGWHTITATVLANDDETASDTITVCVGGNCDNNPPYTPSKPSGPTTGKPDIEYNYTTSTTDPDNDMIKYGWEWTGDNNVDGWTDFYNSSQICGVKLVFDEVGTYNIRVKAEDIYGAQSSFSSTLTVVITEEQINPIFIAHFMTPEGDPYPFDIIISDGEWRQEYKNVTYIETEVPASAKYLFAYDFGENRQLGETRLNISSGEILELEFYAHDIIDMIDNARVKPYIMFQEKGANAELSWDWDSDTLTLTYYCSFVTGKLVAVDVVLDDNISKPPNWADLMDKKKWKDCNDTTYGGPIIYEDELTYGRSNCERNISIPDAINCIEFTAQDCIHTQEYKQNDTVLEIIDIFYHHGFTSLSETTRKYKQIDPGLEIIDIFCHHEIETTLKDLYGKEYPYQYIQPRYTIAPNNYILKTYRISEEYASLYLPIKVITDKGTVVYAYNPKISELESYTFSIGAENPLANSSYSNLQNNPDEKTISVDVSTKYDHRDWWGFFVIPDTEGVKKLTAYIDETYSTLDILYDYTINHVGEYNFIVVRIEPDVTSLKLEFGVNNPPDKPSIFYNSTDDKLVVSATDPDLNQIKYGVSWDNDGNVDKWTSYYSSGAEASISCEGRKGTVGVIAEDANGAMSEWVSVKSKNIVVEFPIIDWLFVKLFQRFPFLNKILNQII